jgi:hypothetical protein
MKAAIFRGPHLEPQGRAGRVVQPCRCDTTRSAKVTGIAAAAAGPEDQPYWTVSRQNRRAPELGGVARARPGDVHSRLMLPRKVHGSRGFVVRRSLAGVLALAVLAGCAVSSGMIETRRQVTSGIVGCSPEEIEIKSRSNYAWKATCRGRTYYCGAGAEGGVCHEELP